jgi:hypothetical protein
VRSWLTLLGGLLVWAVHFFMLYAVGSVFLTTDLARVLTVALTIAGLAANGWLGLKAWRGPCEPQERWSRTVTMWGLALGSIGIFWQGMVAVII